MRYEVNFRMKNEPEDMELNKQVVDAPNFGAAESAAVKWIHEFSAWRVGDDFEIAHTRLIG